MPDDDAGSGTGGAATEGGTVRLDDFVVATSREMSGAALAINEQRFAGNIKTVLHTDAMGDIIQNNLGEFVKYLPGVDVGTDQMNSVQIGLRGLPSSYTNIALDGDDVNTAGAAGFSRSTSLQAISLNNASRIEITKVPTPDMPASSLGGSINMVSRTAFEASRPELRFKAYVNQNSHQVGFHRKPGGGDGPFPGALEVLNGPADGSMVGSFVIGVPIVGPMIDIGIEEDSFTPVGIFLTYPFVLAASGDAPYSNMAELAAHAQDNDVVLGHFGAGLTPTKASFAAAKKMGFEFADDSALTCWIVTLCRRAMRML